MPEWYGLISTARYAGIPAPEFVRLPVAWQEMYEAAQLAELEAKHATVEVET
jgi:hypothetical protein